MRSYSSCIINRLDDSSSAPPAGLKKLRSLILLTYYDDDNPVQTCEEKLLLSTLKGFRLFISLGAITQRSIVEVNSFEGSK